MTISGDMLKHRLQELRQEFDNGSRQLELLDRKREEVHATLLRIKGAIQVLEELSADTEFADESKPASPRIASG